MECYKLLNTLRERKANANVKDEEAEAIKEMVGKKNTFSVGFYKKDGTFRTGVFRLGKNQRGVNN